MSGSHYSLLYPGMFTSHCVLWLNVGRFFLNCALYFTESTNNLDSTVQYIYIFFQGKSPYLEYVRGK